MGAKIVCNRCLRISGCIEETDFFKQGERKRCFNCEDLYVCLDASRRAIPEFEINEKTIFLKCEECLIDDCLS